MGDQDEIDYEAVIAAGADDFLHKPILFQELMLRIHWRFLADLHDGIATILLQAELGLDTGTSPPSA